MHTVLIVDDELKLLEVLSVALENMGYATLAADSAESALRMLQEDEVHLVLSDLKLPGLSGRELLAKVKSVSPGLPVVIMTAYASLKDAVEIIKEGAFDYIVKPFDLDVLEATIASALRFFALSRDNRELRKELGRSFTFDNFIGVSQAFEALKQSIMEVSQTDANVLITGESGTGKELVAKAIHYTGPRASAPFVTINCAAIPESLLESELFGHEKGAYTGAASRRTGKFAQADSGTVFLDEIGDMPLPLQAKILRCIQEKVIEPVGARSSQKVDVRLIAATNQDLPAAIDAGKFRSDLFYRLNVYPIVTPPLRERKEDIRPLAEHFAERMANKMAKAPLIFGPEAMRTMQEYAWPGNVRELENCIERLSIIGGGIVTRKKLEACAVTGSTDEKTSHEGNEHLPGLPLLMEKYLEDIERDLVMKALDETGGIQVKAAELLGISERSMWHRIKKLGINILHSRKVQ